MLNKCSNLIVDHVMTMEHAVHFIASIICEECEDQCYVYLRIEWEINITDNSFAVLPGHWWRLVAT